MTAAFLPSNMQFLDFQLGLKTVPCAIAIYFPLHPGIMLLMLYPDLKGARYDCSKSPLTKRFFKGSTFGVNLTLSIVIPKWVNI